MIEKNINSISITDVVNLIIDKNIKKINDVISEKNNIINDLRKKHYDNEGEKIEKLKNFMTEHFDETGLNHFLMVMSMMGRGRFGGMFQNMGKEFMIGLGESKGGFWDDYKRMKNGFKELYLCGLFLKDDKDEYKIIDSLESEIDDLYRKISEIRNSKDKLIAEVTIQKLTSIDVDFEGKLDSLAERIFENKKLN